jgi:rhodanese-related sulfurtransferase/DNA-binding transcriptional ArsR family regulator
MSSPTPKQVLFGHFAAVARTIGNAHRIDLLQQLAQGEQSVETLARKTGLTVANASQHLQHLRRAGLVTARRNGTFIYYRLADDAVLDVIAALRRLAERNLAEVEKVVRNYFNNRDAMEPVTREELAKRLKSGDVTVLDVRPEDEFALAHVPGAINVPLKELEKRTAEIDSTKDIVAYCRGAYCVYSYEAVAKLRAKGFSIRRLEDGLPEWKAAGLPVESASKES